MFTSFLTRQGAHTFIAHAPDGGGGGEEEKIPKSRLDREIADRQAEKERADAAVAAQKKAETDLAEAQRAARAAENENKPELDRVKAENEDLKLQVQTLTTERDQGIAERDDKIIGLERGAWVRDAALKAGFHDPADALLRIDLKELRTETAAQRAVKDIAEDDKYKHLVKPPESEKSQADLTREILKGGKVKLEEGDDGKKIIPADQLNAMTQDQLVELGQNDPELYSASLAAAAAEPAAA